MNEIVEKYFSKGTHNYISEYGPVEDHLFFNGHLFYAVDCSLYKDSRKILEIKKRHKHDFINKIAVDKSHSILLIAIDSGYVLTYKIQENLIYMNLTEIYESEIDEYYDEPYKKPMYFIGIEIDNNIITLDLNTHKEYYRFNTNNGSLEKV